VWGADGTMVSVSGVSLISWEASSVSLGEVSLEQNISFFRAGEADARMGEAVLRRTCDASSLKDRTCIA
jgi:hypothetical protein